MGRKLIYDLEKLIVKEICVVDKMKPMLPTLTMELPKEENWCYEIKYDGFRGILEWEKNEIHLWSRNGKDLLPKFPEIKKFLTEQYELVNQWLPLKLDGELVILENNYKGNFWKLQMRNHVRSTRRLSNDVALFPATFLAFDLLTIEGKNITLLPYIKRKKLLEELFNKMNFPLTPSIYSKKLIQYVPYTKQVTELIEKVVEFESEGIVAKKEKSQWIEGKRSSSWQKYKNWKTVTCFIIGFDEVNDYFDVGVYKDEQIFRLGLFKNGLDRHTKEALQQIIYQNRVNQKGSFITIEPAICLDLYYLDWRDQQFREPYFKQLRLELDPSVCTYTNFLESDAQIPKEITVSHPEKILWKTNEIKKIDYLRYLRTVSAFMLPYLKNRPLTVIRAPHGEFGEYFYQKNYSNTLPEYIQTISFEGNEMILCNDLKTLLWLGNQLAIEYHIPFHTVNSNFVEEIVIDLDPPSRNDFHLAVYGASIIKEVLDHFSLNSFVKFSGNKGMQIYIPLPTNTFNWEETRIFTEFLAEFLVTYNPKAFTTERLKKNRGGKLYVDYVQHGKGKTIIAPYSVRIASKGLVATPLYWGELSEDLNPDVFTMEEVFGRLERMGDPFLNYFSCKSIQPFQQVLSIIQGENKH